MSAQSLLRVSLVLASSTGGVGQHLRSVSERLAVAGHSVSVYASEESEKLFGFREVADRVIPVEIPAGTNAHAALHTARAVRTLRDTSEDAHVIHAHGYRAGLVGLLARRDQPLVVTWHNTVMAQGWKYRLLSALETRVARGATLTLTASSDLQQRALVAGAPEVRLAPVAAPVRAPSQRDAADVCAEFGAEDAPLILSVGRLHPQKNHDVLIRAATAWKKRIPAPRVVIVGEGPERERLENLIRELDAPVTLAGHRDDVPDLIKAADICVVASQWEARQLFAQEALQAGIPLVATAVGGVPELVGNAAVLVPPGEPDTLAHSVSGLLDNETEHEALSQRGVHQAASWPTEDDVARAVESAYMDVVRRRTW